MLTIQECSLQTARTVNCFFLCASVCPHTATQRRSHFPLGPVASCSKPQTTREPRPGGSPSRQLPPQPQIRLWRHLSTLAGSQLPTLSTSNQSWSATLRHSLHWFQFYLLGPRRSHHLLNAVLLNDLSSNLLVWREHKASSFEASVSHRKMPCS